MSSFCKAAEYALGDNHVHWTQSLSTLVCSLPLGKTLEFCCESYEACILCCT